LKRCTRREWIRFCSKIIFTDKCWLWKAGKFTSGYGSFCFKGRDVRAHRFAYLQLVGEVPKGLELDHTCDNRHCVNPSCLKPVTHKENTLKGISFSAMNARKTHCKRGHALFGSNVYVIPSTGSRQCLSCQKRPR
jgi:HNH endonuclease